MSATRIPRTSTASFRPWNPAISGCSISGVAETTPGSFCRVVSAVQGAAVAVDQSGSRIISGSVKASNGLSAHSPVIVCRKMEFGRK